MSDYQIQKKVYTMEDNVKYISFGIKDIVKELKELNMLLSRISHALPKNNGDSPPF